MNRLDPIRVALAILAVAMAPLAAAQTANANIGTEDSSVSEAGTIPAARPGLPQLPEERGAQGPIRSETRPTADPSIRPFLGGPDIRNGLWETLAGNQVVRPGAGPDTGNLPTQTQ